MVQDEEEEDEEDKDEEDEDTLARIMERAR
jgi:hypothetical protein